MRAFDADVQRPAASRPARKVDLRIGDRALAPSPRPRCPASRSPARAPRSPAAETLRRRSRGSGGPGMRASAAPSLIGRSRNRRLGAASGRSAHGRLGGFGRRQRTDAREGMRSTRGPKPPPRKARPGSCWRGTTGTAATCRGARRPARRPDPYRGLAQRNHAAADDGRNGGRGISGVSSPAGPRSSKRSPRRSSTRCCMPGRGSATTPARATCTDARGCWSREHGGRFPDTRGRPCGRSPGSAPTPRRRSPRSPSTARPPSVDGNVERVVARLFAVEEPAAATPSPFAAPPAPPVSRPHAGGRATTSQAMMDLGATVCTPRSPRLRNLPVGRRTARRSAAGPPSDLPTARDPGADGPTMALRHRLLGECGPTGRCCSAGAPRPGFLGGMMEVPSTDWTGHAGSRSTRALAHAPVARRAGEPRTGRGAPYLHPFPPGVGRSSAGRVVKDLATGGSGVWVAGGERLGEHALPSVMKKVVRHALSCAGAPSEPG